MQVLALNARFKSNLTRQAFAKGLSQWLSQAKWSRVKTIDMLTTLLSNYKMKLHRKVDVDLKTSLSEPESQNKKEIVIKKCVLQDWMRE